MGDVHTRRIGWYGKLPWVGDFVGHGLPWQRTWDEWLQRSLPAAEAAWGGAALRERVRGMAPWQLLLPAADDQGLAWCGIVAGSTDRVGRTFPLLVAEGLPQAVLDALPLLRLQARMLALSDWLWEAAAFESLEEFEQGAAAWAATERQRGFARHRGRAAARARRRGVVLVAYGAGAGRVAAVGRRLAAGRPAAAAAAGRGRSV
jgi:type VI secretion system ImpM family protein